MTELERKMSTRRTRQELIEQGVLKEVPDNGKSASVSVPVHHVVSLTARGPRLFRPPTVEASQRVMAGRLCSQAAVVWGPL